MQAQRIMTGQVSVPTPASLISNAQHFWGTGF